MESGRCKNTLGKGRVGNQRSWLTFVFSFLSPRFVNTSTSDVKAEQAKDSQAVVKEIENLKKKENYLEQTLKNSQEHMDAIFKRGG
jgi:prefoldin subunit 1